MKDTLAQQPTNTLSTESFVAHKTNAHTEANTDDTLQTYMLEGMGRKTTLANDTYPIPSKVSAPI